MAKGMVASEAPASFGARVMIIVAPRNYDTRAAITAAQRGELHKVERLEISKDHAESLELFAPIIVVRVPREVQSVLRKRNKIIPFGATT